MQKEQYFETEMEIIYFEGQDIITGSEGDYGEDDTPIVGGF